MAGCRPVKVTLTAVGVAPEIPLVLVVVVVFAAEVVPYENQYDVAVDALKGAAKEGMHKLPCDSAELSKWKGKASFDRVCHDAAKAPGGLVDDEDVVGVDVVQ